MKLKVSLVEKFSLKAEVTDSQTDSLTVWLTGFPFDSVEEYVEEDEEGEMDEEDGEDEEEYMKGEGEEDEGEQIEEDEVGKENAEDMIDQQSIVEVIDDEEVQEGEDTTEAMEDDPLVEGSRGNFGEGKLCAWRHVRRVSFAGESLGSALGEEGFPSSW